MPRNVAEWDRRRSVSLSMSDYHMWVLRRIADESKKRDRAVVVCGLIEAEADRLGWTHNDYLRELKESLP